MATTASINAVNQDYTNILFRTATTSEATTLATGIDNGTYTLATAANFIATNTEANTYVDPVVRLYQAAFNRAPDYAGLKAWVTAFRGGLSLQSIAQGFVASPEFALVYTSATPTGTQLATKLYSNVLNRSSDPNGFQAWTSFLGTTPSTATMAQALLGFANSSEFVANSTQSIASWQQNYATSNSYTTNLFIGNRAGATIPVTASYTASVNGGQADAAHARAIGVPGTGGNLTGTAQINGGGTATTLLIADLGSLSASNFGVMDLTDPTFAGLAISNIGSATIASNEGVVVNATNWGLGSLSVTAKGYVNVVAPGTTAVTIANTVPVAGPLFVTGGSSITVAETNGSVVNTGNLVVVGSAGLTTAVSITQTQAATSASTYKQVAQVYVVDPNSNGAVVNGYPTAPLSAWTWAAKAGTSTLTSVTLDGCGNNVLIEDDAMTSLTLANSTGYVSVFNTTANQTLTLTLNNVSYKTYNATLNYATGTAGGVSKVAPTALKIVTTGGDSSIYINDVTAASMSVTGTQTLDLSLTPQGLTAVTAITVGGSAGLKVDTRATAGLGVVTSINGADGSGPLNVVIDPSKTTFVGGGGTDFVTITADPKMTVAGGPAPGNELVLAADCTKMSSTGLKVNATHFTTVGFNSLSLNAYDFSLLPSATAIDVMGLAGDLALTNVPAGTPLAIDAATGHALSYKTADTNGSGESVTVTLGTAATSAMTSNLAATTSGFSAVGGAGLTLEDNASAGIATVTITSLNTTANQTNVISTLTDPGLQSLTISGTAGLTVTSAISTGVSSFSLANNASGTATIPIADLALTTLAMSGTGALNVTVTLATTGLTVTDSNGSANITLSVPGAALTKTDTITLGSTTGNTGALFSITAGAHAGLETIVVGTGGTSYASAANYVITGAGVNDTVKIAADSTATGTSAGNTIAAGGTLSATITNIESSAQAAPHTVYFSQFGGNTYFAESASGTLGTADTTIVEVVGVHTFTATSGVVTLLT